MNTKSQKTIIFLSTWGWIGFSPLAPGTFGSLAALPLCMLVSMMPVDFALVFIAVLIVLATWIAHAAEKLEARNDPKHVVIDEVCGMVIALFALPFSPGIVAAGVALFRGFDIFKPFPINWADRKVGGGLGIMLDDIIAGIIANGLIRLGRAVFSQFVQ